MIWVGRVDICVSVPLFISGKMPPKSVTELENILYHCLFSVTGPVFPAYVTPLLVSTMLTVTVTVSGTGVGVGVGSGVGVGVGSGVGSTALDSIRLVTVTLHISPISKRAPPAR